jgi:hypothetical protein
MRANPVRIASLLLAACAAPSAAPAGDVPFQVVESRFAPGDRIEVREVQAETPAFESGGRLRVRGTYALASRERATLYLGLTNGRFEGRSSLEVAAGEGTFDFTVKVVEPGAAHVSFYAGSGADNCIGKLRFASVPGAPR